MALVDSSSNGDYVRIYSVTGLQTRIIFFPKVVGAKVVTNARSPGARCYGFVTMATSEEATKCINHLHRTELHGKMISVEKASGSYSMTV